MFSHDLKKEIAVEGMSCSHCAKKIETALEKVDNIKKVKVSLNDGKVTVFYKNSLSTTLIKEIIEDLGYQVISA